MLRPQQRRVKTLQNAIANLKKNDRSSPSGGILGKVTKVEDQYVEVEIAPNVKIQVVKRDDHRSDQPDLGQAGERLMLDFPRWKVWSISASWRRCARSPSPASCPKASTKNWPVHPRINLGLDLAGGSYLLLEANTDDLIATRLEPDEASRSRPTCAGATDRHRRHLDRRRQGQLHAARHPARSMPRAQRAVAEPTSGVGMTGQRDWDIAVVNVDRFVLTPTKAGIDAGDRQRDGRRDRSRPPRIDALGTREPTIIRQGDDRIVVQVPGLQNPQRSRTLLGKTAKLEFKLVDTDADAAQLAKGIAPIGDQILPYPEAAAAPSDRPVRSPVMLRRRSSPASDLTDAPPETDPADQRRRAVGFQFNTAGRQQLRAR